MKVIGSSPIWITKGIIMSLEQAKKIRRRNRDRLIKIRDRARAGDKQAALEILRALTRQCEELEAVGYRISTEDESPASQLVAITKEWAEAERQRRERRREIHRRLEERDYKNVDEFQELLRDLSRC